MSDGEKDKLEEMLAQPMEAVEVGHLGLEKLKDLAARRRGGEEVSLPGHLTACPVCLELYGAMVEGEEAVSQEAMARFVGVFERRKTAGRIGRWRWAGVAAGVLVMVGLAGVYVPLGGTSAAAEVGGLMVDGGAAVAVGERVPAGVGLVAQQETRAGFGDGSAVVVEKGTKLAIRESNFGSKTVVLEAGRVEASVAKQAWGRKFEVSTPLGPVTVVGTKFSVACGKEKVVVYEHTTGKQGSGRAGDGGEEKEILVVRVKVSEGVVRVNNRSEEVRVTAGEEAVMREHEPRVEVSVADGKKVER